MKIITENKGAGCNNLSCFCKIFKHLQQPLAISNKSLRAFGASAPLSVTRLRLYNLEPWSSFVRASVLTQVSHDNFIQSTVSKAIVAE